MPSTTASDRLQGPQYLALRNLIAGQIEAGAYTEGKLPSERQFQNSTGAARGTIREALFQLEAESLIYRRDRSGWYVSPAPVTYDPTRWAGFMSYVSEQGRLPATETLSTEIVQVPSATASLFGTAPKTSLFLIQRRRRVDGRPVLVERITVDPALAPKLARGCDPHPCRSAREELISGRRRHDPSAAMVEIDSGTERQQGDADRCHVAAIWNRCVTTALASGCSTTAAWTCMSGITSTSILPSISMRAIFSTTGNITPPAAPIPPTKRIIWSRAATSCGG